MTIAIALIVKNEERVLARCLDSIAGAVDEIVIVDTGSTDSTKEIASRYTDRLFDFVWRQDFSAARQFAFDQVGSEWVAWIDADDVVRQAEAIKPLINGAPSGVDGFYWRYDCDRDSWGNAVCEFWRERCVRNNGAFRWQGKVHEVLVPQRTSNLIRSSDVVIEHRRDPHRVAQKLNRNLEILESEYAASQKAPTPATPRLLFYLGNEYASAGESRKALSFYQQYLQIATWEDERYLAQTRVAGILRGQGRYDQAIHAGLQALETCPHWPDAYFGLAESYYYKRDWHKVIHWTELGRAMPRPDTLHILNPLDYRFNWIIFYTNALFHVGETKAAIDWTRRALEIKPDDPWHQQNFLTFASTTQNERSESFEAPAPSAELKHSLPKPRKDSRDRLHVVWEGPQFVRASFAFVNRQMCATFLQLNNQAGIPERASRLSGSPLIELSVKPEPPFDFGAEEEPERFGALAERFNAPLSKPADVCITMSYMSHTEPPAEGRWVIYQPWDYTSMPRKWLTLFESYADEVWVPSRFVWQSFVDSGVSPQRVQIIPHGVDPKLFNPTIAHRRLKTEKTFKFLFVGGTLWRKGIDILLDSYRRAFSRADDVSLVIKDVGASSYYRDHNARERIHQFQNDSSAPEILYLTQDVPDREVAGLYTSCDCLVHPFRGEGFALPVVEAMACGLPVVVTKGGPCDDYCSDKTAYWIPAQLKPVNMWEEMIGPACVLEPDAEVLIENMRFVFEHRSEAKQKGTAASEHILRNYTWQHAAEMAVERIRLLSRREDDTSEDKAELEYAAA